MTNEEKENAIRCLKLWIEREPQLQTYKTALEALEQEPVYYPPCIDCNKKMNEIRNAYDNITTKALEQDLVLDKIKQEFIAIYPKNYAGDIEADGCSCVFSLNRVLDIIDKYKAES